MTSLIEASLAAPLIGFNRRWPGVLHAVDLDEAVKAWPNGTVRGVCGAQRLRVLLAGDVVGEWPPRVAGLPPGWSRCRICHDRTGRRRPRTDWKGRR